MLQDPPLLLNLPLLSNGRKVLLALRGLPGSGQTPWSEAYTVANPDWIRVSDKDLRLMLKGGIYQKGETCVEQARQRLLTCFMLEGSLNVIVDNFHIDFTSLEPYRLLCRTHNYELVIGDFTPTPVQDCYVRNKQTANPEPRNFIRSLNKQVCKHIHNSSERVITFPPFPVMSSSITT
jgi:predicted kinase